MAKQIRDCEEESRQNNVVKSFQEMKIAKYSQAGRVSKSGRALDVS